MEQLLSREGGSGDSASPHVTALADILSDTDLRDFLLDWDDVDVARLAETVLDEASFLEFQSTADPHLARSEDSHDDGLNSEQTKRAVTRSALCRQRQRQELHQLRQDVVEMEDELQRRHRASQSGSLVANRQGSDWHNIVERERQRKRRALIANERLRELVCKQHKIATRLHAACLASQRLQLTCQDTLSSDSWQEEDGLQLHGVEQRELPSSTVPTTVEAMSGGPWVELSEDYEEIKLLKDSIGRMTLEVAFSRAFSCDFAQSSANFWRSYCSDLFPRVWEGAVSLVSTTDSMMGTIEVPVHIHGQNMVTRSRFRCCLVQESPQRVVIRWKHVPDTSDDDTASNRLQLHTEAYLCVESLQSDQGPVTVVQGHSVSRPEADESVVSDPIRAASGKLVDFVQAANDLFLKQLEVFFVGCEHNHSHEESRVTV